MGAFFSTIELFGGYMFGVYEPPHAAWDLQPCPQ